MKTTLIILLFIIFFSGISKERKLWIGYSWGENKRLNLHGGIIFTIAAEDQKEATEIFIRDRSARFDSFFQFQVLNADGLTTDYHIWEITDSIIHKK
jgi:hypothetical protein